MIARQGQLRICTVRLRHHERGGNQSQIRQLYLLQRPFLVAHRGHRHHMK